MKFSVSQEGHLSDPQIFAERGEFSSAIDAEGNVYIADGQIYIYDQTGKEIGEIKVPERPVTIIFGGEKNQTLFITTRGGLYNVRLK